MLRDPQVSDLHVNIRRVSYFSLQNFYWHLRRNSSSIVLSFAFGRRAPRYATKEVTDFFHVQELWEHALTPGAHPVRTNS
jgi:hypothetical protein